MEVRNRLIILGLAVAAAVVTGLIVLDSRVFKRELDPGLQSYFSTDKNSWWKELPVEVLPSPSGIYNAEGAKAADEDLKQLKAGWSVLGDLPIVEVSHSQDGSVEIVLSKHKASNCGSAGKPGIIKDEVRLELVGYADINFDGVAEQCVFIGRANRSDTCNLGTGNFMSYGAWFVFEKSSPGGKVELRQVRNADCGNR
jgi:hypothetical protein